MDQYQAGPVRNWAAQQEVSLNVMRLNHLKTTIPHLSLWKIVSHETSPGCQKGWGHWTREQNKFLCLEIGSGLHKVSPASRLPSGTHHHGFRPMRAKCILTQKWVLVIFCVVYFSPTILKSSLVLSVLWSVKRTHSDTGFTHIHAKK